MFRISLPFGCFLGPDSWAGRKVEEPWMKNQPSFGQQLAGGRLRAPRGEMNPGDTLSSQLPPCMIVALHRHPRKVREGQR